MGPAQDTLTVTKTLGQLGKFEMDGAWDERKMSFHGKMETVN